MPIEANTEVKMIPEFSPRYDVFTLGASSRRIDFPAGAGGLILAASPEGFINIPG